MAKTTINPAVFSGMPLPLVARCVSFLVACTQDVAAFRLVSKSFGRSLKSHLVSSSSSLKGGNFIECPPKKTREDGAFVTELLDNYDPEDMYDYWNLAPGEVRNIEDLHTVAFPGSCILRELYTVGQPTYLNDEGSGNKTTIHLPQHDSIGELSRMKKLVEVCKAIYQVASAEELREIAHEAQELGLYDPCETTGDIADDDNGEQEEAVFLSIPCMLKVWLPQGDNADCLVGTTAMEDGSKILTIESVDAGTSGEEEGLCFRLPQLGSKYHAVVLAKQDGSSSPPGYEAFILAKVVSEEDNYYDDLDACPGMKNTLIEHIWKKHQEQSLVEGVVIVDEAVGEDLHSRLLKQVQALADKQYEDNQVDYHPNSYNVVRDLVHPGLYPYVKDITPLRAKPEEVAPCVSPGNEITELEQAEGEDFWGRAYEESTYQWLPSYFNISNDGMCTIEHYINNLTRRDDAVNSPLYGSLARLFEQSLPYIESVYSYVRSVRPMIRIKDEYAEYDDSGLKKLQTEPYSLRGQRLQVITKIVDYELIPGQEHSGVWHVEGMSHEEIVLTAIYILDRDEEIEGGALDFKRAMFRDEAELIFATVAQSRPHSLETTIEEGLVPLGRVETPAGRLVVFPNSHVHKVQTMIHKRMENGRKQKAKRRIVVFFLVNPLRRIVSTREVAPQQGESGTMSHEDALAHRLDLMKQRKFHKQDWNVREIELCEH